MKKYLIAFAALFTPMVTWAQEAATAVANTATTVVTTTAGAAAPVVTTVDFSGWATAAAPIIVTLLGILMVAAIRWLVRKTGTEKLIADAQIKLLVDKLTGEATDYAVSNLKNANWLKVETKNEALGFALNYVEEHGADIVKMSGLDTTKILQKLEAKLIKYDENPGQWDETAQPTTPAATQPVIGNTPPVI